MATHLVYRSDEPGPRLRVARQWDRLVLHRTWLLARDRALAGLARRPATVALLGEPGTGKTLLLHELVRILRVGGIPTRLIGAEIPVGAAVVAERDGGDPRTVVLIDDANRLAADLLLTLVADPRRSLVLAERPAFATRLDGLTPPATLLRLAPLRSDEVATFLAESLPDHPDDMFSDAAIVRLSMRSRGVPRLLHELAGTAMFLAERDQAKRVEARHVDQAATIGEPGPAASDVPIPMAGAASVPARTADIPAVTLPVRPVVPMRPVVVPPRPIRPPAAAPPTPVIGRNDRGEPGATSPLQNPAIAADVADTSSPAPVRPAPDRQTEFSAAAAPPPAAPTPAPSVAAAPTAGAAASAVTRSSMTPTPVLDRAAAAVAAARDVRAATLTPSAGLPQDGRRAAERLPVGHRPRRRPHPGFVALGVAGVALAIFLVLPTRRVEMGATPPSPRVVAAPPLPPAATALAPPPAAETAGVARPAPAAPSLPRLTETPWPPRATAGDATASAQGAEPSQAASPVAPPNLPRGATALDATARQAPIPVAPAAPPDAPAAAALVPVPPVVPPVASASPGAGSPAPAPDKTFGTLPVVPEAALPTTTVPPPAPAPAPAPVMALAPAPVAGSTGGETPFATPQAALPKVADAPPAEAPAVAVPPSASVAAPAAEPPTAPPVAAAALPDTVPIAPPPPAAATPAATPAIVPSPPASTGGVGSAPAAADPPPAAVAAPAVPAAPVAPPSEATAAEPRPPTRVTALEPPLLVRPTPSAERALTAPLPSGAFTTVTVRYPAGNDRAAQRAASLAAQLRQDGFEVGNPIPVAGRETAGIRFVFSEDRDAAAKIALAAHRHAGELPVAPVQRKATDRRPPPRPGSIDITVSAEGEAS